MNLKQPSMKTQHLRLLGKDFLQHVMNSFAKNFLHQNGTSNPKERWTKTVEIMAQNSDVYVIELTLLKIDIDPPISEFG